MMTQTQWGIIKRQVCYGKGPGNNKEDGNVDDYNYVMTVIASLTSVAVTAFTVEIEETV